MADLRESLAASLETYEAQESAPAAEVPQEAPPEPTAEQRARDTLGRFAKEDGAPASPPAPPTTEAGPAAEVTPVINRPSSWKKDYWPLYDKLYLGQALTADEAKKLADYTNQRETEFKTGVSTYKAEAEAAKEIQNALAPFMPDLQRYNIKPGEWIARLGTAHQRLHYGSPQEKLSIFKQLAQEYQVPLAGLGEGAEQPVQDPQSQWLTQKLSTLESAWNTFQSKQEEQSARAMQEEITRFASAAGHEHFEAVKDQMAGLLQSGMAQDLQSAYDKAVRLSDDIWPRLQAQQATQKIQQDVQAVAKAKAAAVSPKSASPSATGEAKPKGLRALLEASIDAASGGGRV
jgi:hypothetical protein